MVAPAGAGLSVELMGWGSPVWVNPFQSLDCWERAGFGLGLADSAPAQAVVGRALPFGIRAHPCKEEPVPARAIGRDAHLTSRSELFASDNESYRSWR